MNLSSASLLRSDGGCPRVSSVKVQVYCIVSPEAPNCQKGHKPQTQIGSDHEEDVVWVVHGVQVAMPGVEHRLKNKPVMCTVLQTTVHVYCTRLT